MSWDLATAKAYLGADDPDTPEGDLIIQQVMDETLSSVEAMLGRKLILTRETVRFLNVDSTMLLMPRFPIRQVHAVDMNGLEPPGIAFNAPDSYVVQTKTGWIESTYFPGRPVVTVDYEGGYAVLPADLERAMWSAFLTLYADTDPLTGAPPAGAGSTVVAGSGEVSSVTIADFGTVKYDVASSVASESAAASSAAWGWLAPWYTTFQRYRAGQAGVGLGVV
jgi:hypothetical protein